MINSVNLCFCFIVNKEDTIETVSLTHSEKKLKRIPIRYLKALITASKVQFSLYSVLIFYIVVIKLHITLNLFSLPPPPPPPLWICCCNLFVAASIILGLTHTHACAHTCTHIHTHAHVRMHAHTSAHVHTCTCKRMHMDICTHTWHVHTHTHTHTHTKCRDSNIKFHLP